MCAGASKETSTGCYWLLKTEPGEWGWQHQENNAGVSHWDGVRNALAQIHLRRMRQGDHAFFYHSGGKFPSVVGVVEVVKAAYPDTSDLTGKSSMVDVRALAPLPKPVPLSVIKADETMRDWILLRQSRLSVLPVEATVWRRVCELGELSPPPICCNENDSAIKPLQHERKGEEEKESVGEEKESVEVLKTYSRSSRKRVVSIEAPIVKTYKSRRTKKDVGDDSKP